MSKVSTKYKDKMFIYHTKSYKFLKRMEFVYVTMLKNFSQNLNVAGQSTFEPVYDKGGLLT